MTFGQFYGHFAAAYGTIWFALMLFALVTQSHVNTGAFGLFGFPIIALVYAFVRMANPPGRAQDGEVTRLRQRLARLEQRLDD